MLYFDISERQATSCVMHPVRGHPSTWTQLDIKTMAVARSQWF